MDRVPDRSERTYRCNYCGFECVDKKINTLTPTKSGTHGDATPTPTTYNDQVYSTDSISFDGDNAKIADSKSAFADNHIMGSWTIVVETGSGTNDGTYTIAERGVTRGEILVNESLTTEDAATAGTVTINRVIYKPNITTGCPFCGSLNSKGV